MRSERQREFLDAAITIVAERGFSKLTIRNLASAVGVTEPAVYRHFESKLALMRAMLEDLQAAILPHFRRLGTPGSSTRQMLSGFIRSLFNELKEHPAFAPFIFSEEAFHNEPELKPLLSRMMKENLSILSDSLTIMQEHHLCREDLSPADLASVAMGTIRLAVSRWHLDEGKIRLSDMADQLEEILSTLFSPGEKQ